MGTFIFCTRFSDSVIHVPDSVDGQGFGKGNLGKKGFDKFLLSHRCNAICSFLKLPAINMKFDAVGTMPATRFMPNEHVRTCFRQVFFLMVFFGFIVDVSTG
jgi:elongation factor 2 kinase